MIYILLHLIKYIYIKIVMAGTLIKIFVLLSLFPFHQVPEQVCLICIAEDADDGISIGLLSLFLRIDFMFAFITLGCICRNILRESILGRYVPEFTFTNSNNNFNRIFGISQYVECGFCYRICLFCCTILLVWLICLSGRRFAAFSLPLETYLCGKAVFAV
jgi:hypothetical protein